jgi:hypothetical protein
MRQSSPGDHLVRVIIAHKTEFIGISGPAPPNPANIHKLWDVDYVFWWFLEAFATFWVIQHSVCYALVIGYILVTFFDPKTSIRVQYFR